MACNLAAGEASLRVALSVKERMAMMKLRPLIAPDNWSTCLTTFLNIAVLDFNYNMINSVQMQTFEGLNILQQQN
uniref:Uncharacterized protein n=1 Tax=Anopheles epiroticus TaxID=199890 RepID=A0A182P5X5_9DIPT